MNLDDVEKLLAIIDDSHFTEIDLRVGDVHLTARKGGAGTVVRDVAPVAAAATSDGQAPGPVVAPVVAGTAAAPAASGSGAGVADDAGTDDQDGVLVRAQIVGVFFRSPSPGAPPFAEEGQEVSADDTIGSIEVMKLFSSVAAGTSGTLVRFLVENAELVEYGQPVALIRPHAS